MVGEKRMWKEIKKNYKFNLSLCIIFFILGLINLIINNTMCRFFHFLNIVIGFIPFFIFSFLLLAFSKKETKTIIKNSLNIAITLLGIFILMFNFVALIVSESFGSNTNVDNYKRTIRVYKNNEAIKHFPRKLPKDIENVEFKEWPSFLQGGGVIYLSYDITDEEVVRVNKEFKDKSKYILSSMNEIEKLGQSIYLTNYMSEAIGNMLNTNISNDFIIYMLGAEKTGGDNYWNHGKEYGIIINREVSRVTYFYEYW